MSFWRLDAIRREEGARGEMPGGGVIEENCIKCEPDSNEKSVSDRVNGTDEPKRNKLVDRQIHGGIIAKEGRSDVRLSLDG